MIMKDGGSGGKSGKEEGGGGTQWIGREKERRGNIILYHEIQTGVAPKGVKIGNQRESTKNFWGPTSDRKRQLRQ